MGTNAIEPPPATPSTPPPVPPLGPQQGTASKDLYLVEKIVASRQRKSGVSSYVSIFSEILIVILLMLFWLQRLIERTLTFYFTLYYIEIHLLINAQREFLVKWAGYGSRYNSWEPETHLENNLVLAQYLRGIRCCELSVFFCPDDLDRHELLYYIYVY